MDGGFCLRSQHGGDRSIPKMSFLLVGVLMGASLGTALLWKLVTIVTGRSKHEGLLSQIEKDSIKGVAESDLAEADNTRRS